jgi:CHAT domain-containing protein
LIDRHYFNHLDTVHRAAAKDFDAVAAYATMRLGRAFGGSMRRVLLILSLLALATAPALAQSPALKQALQQFNALGSAGNYAAAEPWAKKVIDLARNEFGADSAYYAAALNNLGELCRAEGRYAEAEPLYQRALAIDAKALGPNDPSLATHLNNLADLYTNEGRYAEAEVPEKRALAIREKALDPNNPDVGLSLNDLGELYYHQGRIAEADPLAQRALAIRQKALGPNHPDVAGSLILLAEIDRVQGRFAEALPLYQNALRIDEKALGPSHPFIAPILDDMAALYHAQGRFADALPLYQRALAIREKTLGPNHPDVATSLNNIATLYDDQGRLADALPLYQRALAIDEKALGPDHSDVAMTLNNLAHLYDEQGRYADAEPLQKRALAIDEKALGPDNPRVAMNLDNLGRLYRVENRFADAEAVDKRALAIREATLGPNHPDVAESLSNLALLYSAEGRTAEALPLIHRAAVITAIRASIAKADSKGGEAELRSRRDIFLNDVAVTGRLAAAGTPDAPQLREEAFAALQWSKASDTAEAVAHMAARFAAGSDALANLVRQRQDTENRLDADEAAILAAVSQPPAKRKAAAETALRADADGLRQRLTQFDGQLATHFPTYAELANPRPVSIAEIQALLAPDQALIVFGIGTNESYLAVVTHGSSGIFGAPIGAKDLSAAVKALRHTLNPEGKTSVPPFEASTAYKLYQQLLAPAEPALNGIDRLYIVTDGALESLPLGVLLTAKPSADTLAARDELRAAPWLARRYAVSVLPSVSSLKALRQFAGNAHASLPFIGFGDPVLTPQPGDNRGGPAVARGGTVQSVFHGGTVDEAELRDLPSLPETAGELRAEAKLFKASAGSVLLLQAATVTAVKHADLSSHRIVAFATHGLLAGDVGIAEPGLVMTPPAQPSPADDGLLKASEIAQLKLNADLVILSACNTAASDGTPGAEGFSGLSKAFLYAGARSLMVSNWSVVSDSTVALMTRVAAHLEEKSVGSAEALRRAELELMDDKDHPEFAHPLFWAPFVVVGEGGVSE